MLLTVSPKSTKRTTTSHLKPLNKIKLFFKWLETRKESLTVLANNLTSTNINKTNKQVDHLTVQLAFFFILEDEIQRCDWFLRNLSLSHCQYSISFSLKCWRKYIFWRVLSLTFADRDWDDSHAILHILFLYRIVY